MGGIEVEIVIDGPPDKVFDVITIAGLWPQWHVLTCAVAGVTQRPFHEGDPIYEFVRLATGPAELEWQITEYDRPRSVKMEAQDGTSITYTFEGTGDGTVFRRVIALGSELGALKEAAVTQETEQASVTNLKALVERFLWREGKGRVLR